MMAVNKYFYILCRIISLSLQKLATRVSVFESLISSAESFLKKFLELCQKCIQELLAKKSLFFK